MDKYLLSGGAVLTMDNKNTFIKHGSILIDEGRIVDVRGDEVPIADSGVNYPRSVILPGLINSHTHLFISMWRGLDDDHTLFPWLEILSPAINSMNENDMLWSNYLGCMEALGTGTTTVRECCRYDPLITADVASELGLRCITGGMPASEWFGEPLSTDLKKLAIQSKQLLEKSEKYNGLVTPQIGAHSPYNCSPEFILKAKSYADDLNIPFGIHLAENKQELEIIRERYGKTPVQHLFDLGILDRNVIADHCVWFSDRDVELFHSSGSRVVHNPLANAKLESGTAPVKKYLEAGIPVALGTDSVVSNNNLNMFEVMKLGIMIQRAAHPSLEDNQLKAIDYLKMATNGGAEVLGLSEIIGSIEIGKRADLIVVELPPEMPITFDHVVSHLVYSANPKDIRAVFVDGQLLIQDGEFQRVDGEKIKEKIMRYFEDRWKVLRPEW